MWTRGWDVVVIADVVADVVAEVVAADATDHIR